MINMLRITRFTRFRTKKNASACTQIIMIIDEI